MIDTYEYDIFISYSHGDGALVRDLYSRLVRYRTPRALRRRHGRYGQPPRRVRVFLDRKSVEAGGQLSGRLIERLEQSQWLVVVCSANSRNRPWVNEEVDRFAALHGPEYILPVVVRENEDTDFDSVIPPSLWALGDSAPVAADILLDGGAQAVRDKILGAVLGFAQNEIAREQERDDARGRRRAAAVMTTGLVLVGAAGVGGGLAFLGNDRAAMERSGLFAQQANELSRHDVGRHADALQFALQADPEGFNRPLRRGRPSAINAPARAQLMRAMGASQLEKMIERPDAETWSIATHEQTQQLAVGWDDGRLDLYRLGDDETAVSIETGIGEIDAMTFSPDGEKVALVSDGRTEIRAAATGTRLSELGSSFPDFIDTLVWQEGDKYLVGLTSSENLWRLTMQDDARARAVLLGNDVTSVSAARNDRVYTTHEDGTFGIWELTTGERIFTAVLFDGGRGYKQSYAASASPDRKRLFTGSADHGNLVDWDLEKGDKRGIYPAHDLSITAIRHNADGSKLLTSSFGNAIKVWDTGTFSINNTHAVRPVETFFTPHEWISELGFTGPDSIAARSRGRAHLWRIRSDEALRREMPAEADVTVMAVSPNGRWVAMGMIGETVLVVDLQERDREPIVLPHEGYVGALDFSPDSRRLVTHENFFGMVRVWDIEEQHAEELGKQCNHLYESVSFHPDGDKILVSGDACLPALLSTTSGEILQRYSGIEQAIVSARFSADGKSVIGTGEAGRIYVWDVDAEQPRKVFGGLDTQINVVAHSPDGKFLATGSGNWLSDGENATVIWNIAANREEAILTGDGEAVLSVAFHPNGRLIATGSEDKTVSLWDIETGAVIKQFRKHKFGVRALAFTPDGRFLLSGGATGEPSGIVYQWEIDPYFFLPVDEQVDRACAYLAESTGVSIARAQRVEFTLLQGQPSVPAPCARRGYTADGR